MKERWTKCYQGISESCVINDYPNNDNYDSVQTQVLPKNVSPTTLSRNHRYQKLLNLGQKLAVTALVCGMAEFTEKYYSLERIVSLWESNNTPFLIIPTEEDKEVRFTFIMMVASYYSCY